MKPTKRRIGASIDWQAVRERLARARAATEAALVLSPERAREVMDERARALARQPTETTPPGELIELLSFALGQERCAVEACFVRAVTRLGDITPVPGVPAFILGITNLRGNVLTIIDLNGLHALNGLHTPRGPVSTRMTELSRIIVLGVDADELGILADAVHAFGRVPAIEVLEPPGSVTGGGDTMGGGIGGTWRTLLRGVTRDALVVIDGSMLLADPRLIVDHERLDAQR